MPDRLAGGLPNLGSYTAAGTINAGDAVKLDSNGDVVQTDTQGETAKGIAMYDAVDGESVAVARTAAIAKANVANTVSAGDLLTPSATAGRLETAAAGDVVFGQAEEDGSSNEALIDVGAPGGDAA